MAISKIPGAGVSADTLEAGDIAANAIGASELADNAVDTAAIAATSITEAKLNADVTDGSAIQTSVKPHIQPGTLYPAWNALLEDNTGHTFTDSSASGHLVRGYGGVNHSGLQKKVGSTSLKFPALTTQRILIDDHADWDFGTGAFTIECWARLNTLGVQQGIMELGGDGNDGWRIFSWHNSNGFISVRDHDDSNDYTITATGGTGVLTVNTWHHLCVTRAASGGAITLYIDGVSKGTATQASAMNNASGSLAIGLQYDNSGSPAEYLNGYLDEIRIVNGTQVYTGNFTPPTALTTSGGTYSDTTNVNTSFTASHTKLLIHSEAGGHSGAYGTAQSDGKKYYYTDIKGSKPIKDPRIGAHFGSQRHKFKSLQLLEQESATHGNNVYSIDGREWCRASDGAYVDGPGKWRVNYSNDGCSITSDAANNCTGMFLEITGYFNDFNILVPMATDAANDIDVTVNGTLTIDGSTTLGGDTTVGTPLGGRCVDRSSLINAGLTGSLQITTVKYKLTSGASEYFYCHGIELIAQDTTSTTTRSQIQIPAQNVVSYGKKFPISATAPHYNPFAFKTDGSTAWASGAHNGTSWPVGTGSSANIDTATSLGLENWKHGSNYYKPYNGGRVVWWIDSSGTLKCSVNMMPPNARSVANSASLTNATAKANASIANNTFYPTIEAGTIDHSLSEVARTYLTREFGNGAGNGDANGSYADFSMFSSTADVLAYVMDDGLTSLCGEVRVADVTGVSNAGCNAYFFPDDTGDKIFFTFIGTGLSFLNYNQSDDIAHQEFVQNLPYGTHVFEYRREANFANNILYIDGIQISTGYTRLGEFDIYQPAKPPIPDDACIIADYMLMADYVQNTANGNHLISKGVRACSQSRDVHYADVNGYVASFYDAGAQPAMGYVASSSNTSNVDNNVYTLPAFGTTFQINGHTSQTKNDLWIDSSDVAQSGTTAGNHGDISYPNAAVPLGLHKFQVLGNSGQDYSPYISGKGFLIASPIHTSSHYQEFETPFLKELVGGDRNMEQTNLVVTADGKTWDEVSRDTSYIGKICVVATWDTGNDDPAVAHVMTEWRGKDGAALSEMMNKDFAIGYNKVICLVDGEYQIYAQGYENDAGAVVRIFLNGNRIMGHYNNDAGETGHILTNHRIKRGDYIQILGRSLHYKEYNRFIITRV